MNPYRNKQRLVRAGLILTTVLFAAFLGATHISCAAPGRSGGGQAGSRAMMIVAENHLYAVSTRSWGGNTLETFRLSENGENKVSSVPMMRGVETIRAHGKLLFFGTNTGLLIYSIENPAKPRYISRHRHFRACDPVVVQGRYAFVTMEIGPSCIINSQGERVRAGRKTNWRFPGRLHVYDVKVPHQPIRLHSYNMKEPGGLGVDGNSLFVLDGPEGLKIFAIGKNGALTEKGRLSDIHGYDLIAYQGRLYVIEKRSIRLYSYNAAKPGALQALGRLHFGVPGQ